MTYDVSVAFCYIGSLEVYEVPCEDLTADESSRLKVVGWKWQSDCLGAIEASNNPNGYLLGDFAIPTCYMESQSFLACKQQCIPDQVNCIRKISLNDDMQCCLSTHA